MFYNKSSSISKPGKGTGEKMPIDKQSEYVPLSKFTDWRRKMDDSWMDADDPFTVDNKNWASVSHYLWAVPFRDSFPEKYMVYSLNSGNKIAKSYDLAKKMNAKEAVDYKDKLDAFNVEAYTVQRETALRSKFSRGEMKLVLLATKYATLLHFENKKTPMVDKLLMFIRGELRK